MHILDHKAVVVSQWTSVLRLVQAELDKDRIKNVTLSGSVPVPARPPLIDAINDPKSNVRVSHVSQFTTYGVLLWGNIYRIFVINMR